ncbi:MAG: CoA-binding protein [Deltaproteobacteria bacterium]|nr:CoA-binding protein [Deltaproteobacteria bacterium]
MSSNDISFFLNPSSVAIIGASTRPGTWGNRIARGLVESKFAKSLYLINPATSELFGLPCYAGLDDVKGSVELAIISIQADLLWEALEACARRSVKGAIIITSGFGETETGGKYSEKDIADFGRDNHIRFIGPNVSGIYDLHANFYATGGNFFGIRASNMSFLCQGGFAVHNIVNRAHARGIGIGKFIHTGNEADLQCTDFLDFLGEDAETDAILMYLEGLNRPREFLKIARKIGPQKPIVVYKGGQSLAGQRAASSHTGAMAGPFEIYRGFFRQARCILASRFETIVELGRALLYYPPLKGSRIGIVTEGGSWGVMLTDYLSRNGFHVPELSESTQRLLRLAGMPYRASTKNPVDLGAAGDALKVRDKVSIVDALLSRPELDAVIIHGYGTFGRAADSPPEWMRVRQENEERVLRRSIEVMAHHGKPLIIGCHSSPFESDTVRNLTHDNIPVISRLEDIIEILSAMRLYEIYRIQCMQFPCYSRPVKG